MKRKGEVRKEMQIRRFYKLKQCWFKILLLSQKQKKIRSLVICGHRQMSCEAGLAANLRGRRKKKGGGGLWENQPEKLI